MNLLKKKNFVLMLWLILIILFSGAGGFLYNYWFGRNYNVRDMANNNASDNSQVVIRDAKQVVVEQDTRSAEVIAATEKVVAGIFKKKADNNYDLLSTAATGLLITSDGWLAANWQTKDGQVKPADYVVIGKDKKIYNIDKIVFDDFSDLTFVHLQNTNSLPIIGFKPSLELTRGQTVFLIGWLKTVAPEILTETRRRDDVLSSDQPFKSLSLSAAAGDHLVAVDFSGKIVGWFNKDQQLVNVDYIINAINALLANKKINKAVLGVNYLNADYHIKDRQPAGALLVKDKRGVAVAANSPAAKAGLKEGDIIYSVDDKEIINGVDLADLIATYQADQKAVIKYWRGADKKEAAITLSAQ